MKIILFPVLCVAVLTGMSGCATQPSQPAGIHMEARSADGVKILSVRWQPDKGGLLVHGTVEREAGYYGTRFRHLDFSVLGPNENILAQQAANFSQNPIPYSRFHAGRTSYSFRIASVPPPRSTIRVSVDCTELAVCKLPNHFR
jgi:hypothetical protein